MEHRGQLTARDGYPFRAAHTGYCRDYHQRWRVPMTVMWHVLMPALADRARQRARRGLPGALPRSARTRAGTHLYGRRLATARGAQRLLEEHVPQISVEQRVIAPRDAGLKRIGHFGFFRRSVEPGLWRPAAAWLAG